MTLTAEEVANSVWKLCQNDQDFDGAAALIRAFASQEGERLSGWQPIASFPKTGQFVEIKFACGAVALAAWAFSPNCGRHDICGLSQQTGIILPYKDQATHWRAIKK